MAIIVSACFAYVRHETSDCSNVEIRMTKLEAMTNDKSRNIGPLLSLLFEFCASFAIRHSCFVIGANLILSKNLASSI
jgi:hypothetical protein